MNSIEQVVARKQALIGRSDSERAAITRTVYQWQARTQVARHVTGILKNPLVLTALGLFLWRMPWRRTFRYSGWALKGWQIARLVRRFLP